MTVDDAVFTAALEGARAELDAEPVEGSISLAEGKVTVKDPAAGTRTETRGCHVRTDHPDRDDTWQRASLHVTLDADGRPLVTTAMPAVAA